MATTSAKRKTASGGDRALLLGTKKGGFLLTATSGRRAWQLSGPFLLGSRVHDFQLDPRDRTTLLMSSTGGHLGPTIYRSRDRGATWEEAKRPPAFERLRKGKQRTKKSATQGLAVGVNLWLTPGHADEEGTWYCGTSPQGLFRSKDGGTTWKGVKGWNRGKRWSAWTNDGKDETPDGAFLHSVVVDPRDARHLYLSLSIGGTFESTDRGKSWKPLNQGVAADFLPSSDVAYGHDPHCMILHPGDPDRLYQQNHCGIYRLDRAEGDTWERIGANMPAEIGDIGFPIVGHPSDPDTVWVFPMDGTEVWPRTSPGGKPAVYRTRDGGVSWERLDGGLPPAEAWFTVYRQALTVDDDRRRPGLAFGTTQGEVWSSANGGERWSCIARHLPKILSVQAARFA